MFKTISLGKDLGDVETIDNVTVPVSLIQTAEGLANSERKLFFIGVMFERNPEWVETDETRYTFQRGRLRETGDFVLSDDHDFVASYKGEKKEFIGEIVGICPKSMVSHTYPKQRQSKSNYVVPFEGSSNPGQIQGSEAGAGDPVVDFIECAGCDRPIPVYANMGDGRYTDSSTARIQRGNFPVPNSEGEFEAMKIGSIENIKFERIICSRCFLTDPDLTRFFNRIGCKIR